MSAEAIQKVRDANKLGILVGLAEVSGVQPRKDIDIYLRDDPKGFNLMILALKHLQDISVDPKTGLPRTGPEYILSYYELAGIHGLPKRAWDGVAEKGDVIVKNMGYCPHGAVTFPTWHRPYLALLEQALFITMIDIAASWADPELKQQYHQSAINFRLPYWDYYRPRAYNEKGFKFPGIIDNGYTSYEYDFAAPLVFTTEELMIRHPKDNESVPTRNPLYSYIFPKAIPNADWNESDLNKIVGNASRFPRDATRRYPLPKGTKELSSIGTFSAALNNLRMDSNRLAIALMANSNTSPKYKEYEAFAYGKKNTSLPLLPPGKQYNSVLYVNEKASGSLENLHNMYHLLCGGGASGEYISKDIGGGGGHMSSVPISAYDPIFWFHHGQIERLFAIWQKVHEGEPATNWFNGKPAEAEKPLWPFRKRGGNQGPDMWSSKDLRTTNTLGYTFADVLEGDEPDVSKRFAALYSWSIYEDRVRKLPKPKAPPIMEPFDVRTTEFFHFIGSDPLPPSALESGILLEPAMPQTALAAKKLERDWYIDTNVTRMAFNGTFTIYFFISDAESGLAPSADVRFLTAGTLAAAHHIFAGSIEDCPNCAAHEVDGTIVSSTSAVTSLLLDFVELQHRGQPGLASLEPRDVEPFLAQRLKWRVVTLDGQNQDVRTLSSEKVFQVGLSSSYVDAQGTNSYDNHATVIEQILDGASFAPDHSG